MSFPNVAEKSCSSRIFHKVPDLSGEGERSMWPVRTRSVLPGTALAEVSTKATPPSPTLAFPLPPRSRAPSPTMRLRTSLLSTALGFPLCKARAHTQLIVAEPGIQRHPHHFSLQRMQRVAAGILEVSPLKQQAGTTQNTCWDMQDKSWQGPTPSVSSMWMLAVGMSMDVRSASMHQTSWPPTPPCLSSCLMALMPLAPRPGPHPNIVKGVLLQAEYKAG